VPSGGLVSAIEEEGREMISAGTILIENGTAVPRFFLMGTESHPNAWKAATNTLSFRNFEKELANAGWTFFYLAGEIRSIAFGFDKQKMADAALRRLMAKVSLDNGNCLEIDAITNHSFLGVPYMSVSGHARRIQQGSIFRR
jgi:hypothetical protein